jgi:hypothetical protein
MIAGSDHMRKLRILLLSILLLITTGCDGVYNVEIYNDRYKEDITITENNSNNWDDKNENDVSFKTLLDEEYNRDNDYYVKEKLSSSTVLGLNYKSDFSLESYGSLGIAYRCYDYFSVLDDNDSVTIITSNKNKCYDLYKWLNNITINIKTNHKVLDNNADESQGSTYIWHLNRQNAVDKIIKLKFSKSEYVNNYENETVKNVGLIIGVVAIVLLVIGIVFLILRARMNKVNKI